MTRERAARYLPGVPVEPAARVAEHAGLVIIATPDDRIAGVCSDLAAQGAFRPVHPVFAYFSTLAPIVFYLAGTPIRKEIAELHLINLRALSPDQFVRHLQDAIHRSLARDVTPAS